MFFSIFFQDGKGFFSVVPDCPNICSVTRNGAQISRVTRDGTPQHDA